MNQSQDHTIEFRVTYTPTNNSNRYSDIMVQVSHYKAVNLARRLTSQNENDILGFSGYEDGEFAPVTKVSELQHTKAVNLARRRTSTNENDILGFSGYEDDETQLPAMSQEACAEIASHILHVSNLPVQCKEYNEIVHSVASREKDGTDLSSLLS